MLLSVPPEYTILHLRAFYRGRLHRYASNPRAQLHFTRGYWNFAPTALFVAAKKEYLQTQELPFPVSDLRFPVSLFKQSPAGLRRRKQECSPFEYNHSTSFCMFRPSTHFSNSEHSTAGGYTDMHRIPGLHCIPPGVIDISHLRRSSFLKSRYPIDNGQLTMDNEKHRCVIGAADP